MLNPTPATRLNIGAQLFVFLLRVAIGWHFLYEGVYKLDKTLHAGRVADLVAIESAVGDPSSKPAPSGDEAGAASGAFSSKAYLENATGPFADTFRAWAANPNTIKLLDLMVIFGLVACGSCLVLGLFTRLAGLGAMSMLAMFYISAPPWSIQQTVQLRERTIEGPAFQAVLTRAEPAELELRDGKLAAKNPTDNPVLASLLIEASAEFAVGQGKIVLPPAKPAGAKAAEDKPAEKPWSLKALADAREAADVRDVGDLAKLVDVAVEKVGSLTIGGAPAGKARLLVLGADGKLTGVMLSGGAIKDVPADGKLRLVTDARIVHVPVTRIASEGAVPTELTAVQIQLGERKVPAYALAAFGRRTETVNVHLVEGKFVDEQGRTVADGGTVKVIDPALLRPVAGRLGYDRVWITESETLQRYFAPQPAFALPGAKAPPKAPSEGNYLVVNKNLIEFLAVALLLFCNAGFIGGLDVFVRRYVTSRLFAMSESAAAAAAAPGAASLSMAAPGSAGTPATAAAAPARA